MTQRHFRALAAALRNAHPSHLDASKFNSPNGEAFMTHQWHLSVSAVADACASANPHFDRARFTSACLPN